MKIESYEFGKMVIDSKTYNTDLIISPQKIKANWWRRAGHSLVASDLALVFELKPKILVIGTGYHGLMDVPNDTEKKITSQNIKAIIQPTLLGQ